MKNKKKIKVGDEVHFHSGNFEGLSGTVTKVDWNSANHQALYGFHHTVALSNGKTGFIEKSEHWDFKKADHDQA